MKNLHLSMLLAAFVFAPHAQAVDANTGDVYDAVNSAPKAGRCFGSAGTANACADTSKVKVTYVEVYSDCVYTGGSTCSNITVSRPNATTAGAVVVACGIDGPDANCTP